MEPIPGRSLARSRALSARAREVIPSCTQTFSKGPTQFVQGVAPTFLLRGRGGHVWDVDGNEYVDWVLALCPIVLGYDDPDVTAAVQRQLADGVTFSLAHPLEVEVAETLTEVIPCAEMVRFAKNGSDATTGAVRAARAATGREMVAVCYDPETEVLTDEGFRPIPALRLGDRVATLNQVTGELEYQPILRLTSRHFAGELVHFTGRRVDLLVTPDHHIYRGYRARTGEISFRLAEARSVLDRRTSVRMTAGARWRGQPRDVVRIASAREVRHTGRSDRGRGHPTKGITDFAPKPFLRFLGYYLTEGWCLKARRPRYEIQLAQQPGRIRDRISATISELGFRPRVRGRHIMFASKELWTFLQDCGTGAGAKRIPGWVKMLEGSLLGELFEALIDGDGTRDGHGNPRKFRTTSRVLADDVCELALKLGLSATVSARRNNGFSPKATIYHVSISREVLRGILPRCVNRVPYSGPVYCLTAPNHVVFARRNGRAIWSGNCGYHGWQDWYIGTTTRRRGVPAAVRELTKTFAYNDVGSLERLFVEHPGRIAGVIMEPVGVVEPAGDFLQRVAAVTRAHGAVLIFDEIVTGFRLALGGAQERFGVTPDLACFGKAMANGFPLAAVVGRRDVMAIFDEIFFSVTFGGEALSLAAAKATIAKLRAQHVIEHLWRQGAALRDGYNALARELGLAGRTQCIGFPPRTVLTFHDAAGRDSLAMKSLVQQEMIKRGILIGGGFNLCWAHSDDDVRRTLEACGDALALLARALADGGVERRLEGPVIQPVFRNA